MAWLNTGPLRGFGRLGWIVVAITLWLGGQTLSDDAKMLARGEIGASYHLIGRDFVNIWHGGRLANAGQVAKVYDRDVYRTTLHDATGIQGIYAFSYPPHMLMLARPFGLLPYPVALISWLVLTFGLLWWAARDWLAEAKLPAWTLLLLPASIINIWAGHFGFLIAAFALAGLRLAKGRPIGAGLAFGLMTVKPHLGVLVPFVLVAGRHWRVIAWSALFAILLALAAFLMFGREAWGDWLFSTIGFQASLIGTHESGMGFLAMMPTVERFAAAFGLARAGSLLLQACVAAITLFLLGQALRKGADTKTIGLLSLVATPLLLPYVFHYDMVASNLAILLLLNSISDRISWLEKSILAAAFLIPVLQMPLAQNGIQVAAPLMLASLAILIRAQEKAV